MSAPSKPKYRTTNWKEYNAALKARGSLQIWLDPEMCLAWHCIASGKHGRSRKYSEAAIQSCLTVKGLFNLALRQAMGMAQSLPKLTGLDWQVPDFSAVSRRQKRLATKPLETGQVWGLRSNEGRANCPCNYNDDTDVLLFWSEETYAKRLAVAAWSAYVPTPIKLDSFIDDWLVACTKK